MKKSLILFAILCIGLHAEDIKTTDGQTLKDATITGHDAIGVTVSHSDGISRITYDQLPSELRKKFNYDPKQAQAQAELERKAVIERDQAMRAQARQALEKQKAEEATNTASATEKKEAANLAAKEHVRLMGKVESVTETGLLIKCPQITDASVYISQHRPRFVFGRFYVMGHPKQDQIVDDEWIDVEAVEDGIYKYGGNKVKKFKILQVYPR
jgi:hypothetical protein